MLINLLEPILSFMGATSFFVSFESLHEKTCHGVSDKVRHKLGCTTTEDGKRLELSDYGSFDCLIS